VFLQADITKLTGLGAISDLELLLALLVQCWAETKELWNLWMVFTCSFGLAQSTSRTDLCLLTKWEYSVRI